MKNLQTNWPRVKPKPITKAMVGLAFVGSIGAGLWFSKMQQQEVSLVASPERFLQRSRQVTECLRRELEAGNRKGLDACYGDIEADERALCGPLPLGEDERFSRELSAICGEWLDLSMGSLYEEQELFLRELRAGRYEDLSEMIEHFERSVGRTLMLCQADPSCEGHGGSRHSERVHVQVEQLRAMQTLAERAGIGR